MRTAIIGGTIITNNQKIVDKAVIYENGKIIDICSNNNVKVDKIIDATNHYVSAGFIDLHVHGGGGSDFMDGTSEAFETVCKTHLKHGTTSLSPTTLACPNEELFNLFSIYRKADSEASGIPNLLGIHLEGPYFALSQSGAQDPAYIKTPNEDEYEEIFKHSDIISRMSFAPELDKDNKLAKALKRHKILGSIGHSDAMYEDVLPAYNEGVTHVTHMYSCMSTIKRINAFRHLGIIECAYLLDNMTVEIIADGKHLPKELLQLIAKQKPLNKISLVTDAMRGADLPENSVVTLGSLDKGQPCIVSDGVAFMMDKKAFAGSVCTADRCVRTMYHLAGCSLEDSVAMMTINPANVLGIGNSKGSLQVGFDADINIFDEDINIKKVIVGGNLLINKTHSQLT